jgi:hypothetical protein
MTVSTDNLIKVIYTKKINGFCSRLAIELAVLAQRFAYLAVLVGLNYAAGGSRIYSF